MIHMDHVTFTYKSEAAAGGVRDIDLTTEAEAQQFIDATSGIVDTIRGHVGDELVDAYISAVEQAKKD